eukprot:2145388-Pyramimonas_sp.AAC.1
MSCDRWGVHLCVAFSRAARVRNISIPPPPPRWFLERGPPAPLREALRKADEKQRLLGQFAAES